MTAFKLEAVREALDRRWEDAGDKLSVIKDALALDEAAITKVIEDHDAEAVRLLAIMSKVIDANDTERERLIDEQHRLLQRIADGATEIERLREALEQIAHYGQSQYFDATKCFDIARAALADAGTKEPK